MGKPLSFKQIAVVFEEHRQSTWLYGLTDGGSVYYFRHDALESDGWRAVPMHIHEEPKPERPVSKSMRVDGK